MATVGTANFDQELSYWLKICYPLIDTPPPCLDRPRPSKMVVDGRGRASYRWLLTETERRHIATLLDIDVNSLSFRGTTMNRERQICRECGKASGLDDIVHNSLELSIFTKEFIIKAFRLGPKRRSATVHDIFCSACGEKHIYKTGWVVSGTSWLF